MRLWLRSSLFVASTVCFAFACGDTDEGGTGASANGPVPAEDFPKRYTDTYCATVAPCCEGAGVPYDDAFCHEKNAVNPDKFAALVNDPSVRFDPAAAGRCLDALAAAGCSADNDLDGPTCGGVFVGSLATGTPCEHELQCAPVAGKRVDCLSTALDAPSTCVAIVDAAAAGEPCGPAAFAQCAPGLTCGATNTCVTAPPVGESCQPGGACAQGAVCSPTFTCQAIAADGEACISFGECAETSFCNQGTCARRLPDNTACASSEACESQRCQAGVCRARTISSCQL
jgi:hypothetical protein